MGTLLTQSAIDAYAVLGVSPEATQHELKAAHRALVRRHHPDVAPAEQRAEATRRVQEINVAYGLVRDPQRRAAYDRAVGAPDSGMDRLVAAAGMWAGRWWLRNRVPLRRGAAVARTALRMGGQVTRRAAAETVGRVLWLALCILGLGLGWLTAVAAQHVTGTSGFLAPLVGALGGAALGNQRGSHLRLRLAGVRMPPDLARLALLVWVAVMAVALWLESLLWPLAPSAT